MHKEVLCRYSKEKIVTERPSAHAVEFVDVASMAKWIQKDGVGNIIAGMVDFLEEDFKKWQSFDKIPRVASRCD